MPSPFGALNNAGYEIPFLRWMLFAVPLQLLLLAGVGALLHVMFSPAPGLRLGVPVPPARLSPTGTFTLLVLAGAIVLWMTSGAHGMTPGTVGLLAATTLLAGRALDARAIDAVD